MSREMKIGIVGKVCCFYFAMVWVAMLRTAEHCEKRNKK